MSSLMNFAFNVFWQTALISIAGFILLKIFAGWSAPKRSVLASSLLIALAVLPFLTGIFIYANIKTVKPESLSVSIFGYNAKVTEGKQTGNAPQNISSPANKLPEAENFESSTGIFPEISSQTLSTAMNIVICIWGAGIIFMLGKLLYGLIFLRGFRFGLTEVKDAKVSRAIKTALTVFNTDKFPEVYISSKVESPITIGIFKPIMILPENLYISLKEDEIKSITIHEFSHIYHYDHLMGIIKRIAIAANWWNPLVYIISAEHSISREEVSDNYVLSQLNPKTYSECLVELAERTCLISSLPATVGMADKHISLEQRIKNILSKTRKREMKTRKKIKGIIFGLTCLSAIFIGGIQYTFADNPNGKKEMDLRTYHKLSSKGRKLSSEEAKKLEIKVSKNPGDLEAVAELLGYYSKKQYKNKVIREKRGKIILQLIKDYPESRILECTLLNSLDDYKTAVKLWKDQVAKHPDNLKILWNASRSLLVTDRKLAEKYLKKGQSLEPENPRWGTWLGTLYSFPDSKKSQDAFLEYKKAYAETKTKNANAILPYLAKSAIKAGKSQDAEKYGHQMLAQAKEIGKKNWNYGNLIYYGILFSAWLS